jgi:enoyl-CoA hydratase
MASLGPGHTVMAYHDLIIVDDGPVRTIIINRPEFRNAINAEVSSELIAAITDAAVEQTVRVIILTGAGQKAFVAGADIRAMANATPAQAEAISRSSKALHEAVRRCPKPIIAAVNGHCLGGGLELAMACDIRLAARSASFGLPEIRLGIVPGGGGTVRLSRLIGSAAARAFCLTGQVITAERAATLGLVYAVVELDELMSAAKKLAGDLAGLSAFALGQLKSILDKAVECDIETGETLEGKTFALCFSHPDQREGMMAFLEKRKPNFL